MDGYPYVSRVFWSHAYKVHFAPEYTIYTYSRRIQKASAHIFAPHLADGKGLATGYTFPFETGVHGIIGHVSPH